MVIDIVTGILHHKNSAAVKRASKWQEWRFKPWNGIRP